MRHLARSSILLLSVCLTSACSHWQGRLEAPREALADPEARHVRLTRTNTQRVEVRVAEIRGDSIYGTLGGSGPVSCVEAGPNCSARLAISEVGFVEVRSFSAIRTASLVIVPVGVIALAILSGDDCTPGPFGDC